MLNGTPPTLRTIFEIRSPDSALASTACVMSDVNTPQYDSFEEYNAAQLRKRSKNTPRTTKSAAAPSTDATTTAKSTPLAPPLGSFIERYELQLFIIVLLVFDSYLSFASVAAQPLMSSTKYFYPIILRLTDVFSTFCTGIFLLECVLLFLLFRLQFLFHVGYLVDVCVIGIQVIALSSGFGPVSKTLNILRYWRLMRLFTSSVQMEKAMHMKAVLEVDAVRAHVKRLEVDAARLNVELDKERESKRAIEAMLHTYKEEVDTLNEALKIAAQDIAEAAQDAEFLDEYEDDEDDEAEGAGKSVSSRSNDTMNRYDQHVATGSARQPPQFRINEDGTFEHK